MKRLVFSAKWYLDEKFYPAVNEDIFNAYCSFKHPENKGQQEKALRMLQNRKIVSVKTLRDSSGIYIRGMIKNLMVQQSDQLLYIFKTMCLVKQLVGALLD